MKILFVPFLLSIFLISGCKLDSHKNIRMNAEPKIVYDSIVTKLPGFMAVRNDMFFWQDGFAKDSFLHIVNLKKHNEIAKIGSIGRGPGQFQGPIITKCLNSNLLIHDMNNDHQVLFHLDSLLSREKHFYKSSVSYRKATKKTIINKDTIVSLWPEKLPFLFVDTPDTTTQFGEIPFSEEFNNSFDVLQGSIAYNNERNLLVYAAYDFPYIAIYKKNGLSFKLKDELKNKFKYKYSNGKIKINSQKKGIMAMTLSKNYIITKQRDYKENNINENKVGINASKFATTLFVYNYKGDLLKIINTEIPISRIDGNINNDIIYTISANPDYILTSLNIEKALKES